ncbi:MAG: TonB-dependent receptor [Bacteroidota bacterium]
MIQNKNRILRFLQPRIIAILLCFAFYIISFTNVKAQDLSQKISVNLKNTPISEVITKITELTQINFTYSSTYIPVDTRITIKVKNKTVKEVFDKIFTENGIEYLIVEKQIVLRPLKTEPVQNPIVKNSSEKKKHTISGYLKDMTSGEILIGASVYAKGTTMGTFTNGYGFYSLTLPEDRYEIVFSFIGYKSVSQNIDLKDDFSISSHLETSNFEIKAVEIVAEKEDEKRVSPLSEMKLNPKTILQMPGFVGDVDIIKSLQSVPGIKAYGDGSTLFYVRGGNSDQNLILVDEVPIYNPSHLFGFFTALAPDAIKDVEAFKGDFPANYGGRLSSVIDIKTKDGNMKEAVFAGSLGPFTSNLTAEGPFRKDKSSFFVSFRRANMNWLSFTNGKTLKINFFDLNAKLNFIANQNNRIFASFYIGNDAISRSLSTSKNSFGISWNNVLGTVRWNHIYNKKLFSNTTLYSSKYNYYLYLSKEFSDYWNSSISNTTIKTDFTFFANALNTVKAGIEISSHASNPGNVHFSDSTIQAIVPVIPRYNSGEFDFYISNDQTITDKISVYYGVRLPVWKNTGETSVYYFNSLYQVIDTLLVSDKETYYTTFSPEPRINIEYSFSNNSAVKVSYTRTTQFIQVLSNSVSPFTSLEVWVPCGPNIEPQKADQYALGYAKRFPKAKLNFSAEVFYKNFMNQVDYEDHANMLYNPLIEGELRFGKSWSYGLELMIRKQEGKFTGWIGYTYSRVFKKIDGVNNGGTFPAFYDRPNDVCINIAYNTGKHWSFSANWIYMTGGPITTPVGFYYYNGYSVPIYGEKNNDRLPDYHRLDLLATLKFNKPGSTKKFQHSLTFTIYNAYARENPISVCFNKIIDDNGNIVVPSNIDGQNEIIPTAISVAGFIPSISYNFKF